LLLLLCLSVVHVVSRLAGEVGAVLLLPLDRCPGHTELVGVRFLATLFIVRKSDTQVLQMLRTLEVLVHERLAVVFQWAGVGLLRVRSPATLEVFRAILPQVHVRWARIALAQVGSIKAVTSCCRI